MSPRKYQMKRRAEAVEDTKRRIVEATLALHAERGIAATGWEDIARRAGVGVGTVYRHFRSVDELLPACGALTREKLAVPDETILNGADTGAARIRTLVRALFGMYARGPAEMRNIREEVQVHPAVTAACTEIDSRIDELVAHAVAQPKRRPLVRALVDFDTWKALTRAGVADPVAAVVALIDKSGDVS